MCLRRKAGLLEQNMFWEGYIYSLNVQKRKKEKADTGFIISFFHTGHRLAKVLFSLQDFLSLSDEGSFHTSLFKNLRLTMIIFHTKIFYLWLTKFCFSHQDSLSLTDEVSFFTPRYFISDWRGFVSHQGKKIKQNLWLSWIRFSLQDLFNFDRLVFHTKIVFSPWLGFILSHQDLTWFVFGTKIVFSAWLGFIFHTKTSFSISDCL